MCEVKRCDNVKICQHVHGHMMWGDDVMSKYTVMWYDKHGMIYCHVMSGDNNSDDNVCNVILHTLQWWVVDVYDFVRSTAVERSAIQWNATANVQPHMMPNCDWWFPTIPTVSWLHELIYRVAIHHWSSNYFFHVTQPQCNRSKPSYANMKLKIAGEWAASAITFITPH